MSISVPVEEPGIARPHAGERRTRSSRSESGDATYRMWLGHTQSCATCRAGASCPMAVRLGRVWREARRG
ncbi:hypothetical protein PV779_52680 [Streptomyces sp. ID01-9D]|nr:hypothetical protein [Streptomyces sp. ID01-9D]